MLSASHGICYRCYEKLPPVWYLLKKKLENINASLLALSISLNINGDLTLFLARDLEKG